MQQSRLGLPAILFLASLPLTALSISGGAARAEPAAAAACPVPPPAPPQSGRPLSPGPKPVAPACITAQGGTSSCPRRAIERYNGAIQAYNVRVETSNLAARRYVDALNGWTGIVNLYARCEIDLVNAQVPRGN